MKKSIMLSVVCCSFIYGVGFINPLPSSSKAIENGGTLYAIDAYQDGVGAVVIQNGRGIDNSAMNNLVFKYGNEAKENNVNLGDQIILSGTLEDKLLAGKLFADGNSCNDGNTNTTGETYLNGICQGGTIVAVNGTLCDDKNNNTINDVYTNGICSGKLTETPVCTDLTYSWNVNTIQCEKTATTTYLATQAVGGYSITADSYNSNGGAGFKKQINGFAACISTCGATVYIKQDGTLSGVSTATNGASYLGIKPVGTGFALYNNSTGNTGSTIYYNNNGSITGNSTEVSYETNYTMSLIRISNSTFKFYYSVAGSTSSTGDGAIISFEPFYSGGAYDQCNIGDTLNGTTCSHTEMLTTTGNCQSQYTLVNGLCIQN